MEHAPQGAPREIPERAPLVPLELPGEGQVHLPIAGLGRRALAALLDLSLLGLAGVLVIMASTTAASLTELDALVGPAALAIGFILPVAGPLLLELLHGGQTPGKRLLELRVLSLDGGPAGRGQIFLRNVVRLVDFLPFGYFIGLCTAFATGRVQRLGDLVAGTVVVREDLHALLQLGLREAPPRWLEPPGLPEALVQAAQRLLDPTRELDAAARRQREREVVALVRRFRPELETAPEALIWARLRSRPQASP